MQEACVPQTMLVMGGTPAMTIYFPRRAATKTTASRNLGGKMPGLEVRAGENPEVHNVAPRDSVGVRVKYAWLCALVGTAISPSFEVRSLHERL